MYNIQKSPILFFTLITLLVATLAIPMAFASPIDVSTDQDSYVVGEQLSVTGAATPNAQVSIQVFDPNDIRRGVAQTTADEAGVFQASNIFTFSAIQETGAWTVTVYDAVADETASATVTLGALSLSSATIVIVPSKAVYGAEAITITVSGNTPMSAVAISVTQTGASQVTVASEASVGDDSKWAGTYMIMAGNDGIALISIVANDAAGNQVEATQTFSVATMAGEVPGLEELEDKVAALESDINGLESDINGLESDIASLTTTVNNISVPTAAPSMNAALVYGALIIGIIAIVIAGVSLARKK
jgi:hypothetical protein